MFSRSENWAKSLQERGRRDEEGVCGWGVMIDRLGGYEERAKLRKLGRVSFERNAKVKKSADSRIRMASRQKSYRSRESLPSKCIADIRRTDFGFCSALTFPNQTILCFFLPRDREDFD